MKEIHIAIISGLIAMFGWGLSDFFSAVSMKKNKLSEEATNFWLYFIGTGVLGVAIVFFNFSLSMNITLPKLSLTEIGILFLLSLINFTAYIFFFKALKIGSLSVISSVFSTYAAGNIIISGLFFGEEIPLFRAISLFIVLMGIILLSVSDFRNINSTKGIKYVIPAVLLFSIFFPLLDKISSKGSSIVIIFFLDFLITLEFFIYARLKGKKLAYKTKSLKSAAIAGIVTTIAGLSLGLGYEYTTLTSVVSVISSGVPIVSTLIGYYLLKERLTKLQYAGLVIIITGGVLLFV